MLLFGFVGMGCNSVVVKVCFLSLCFMTDTYYYCLTIKILIIYSSYSSFFFVFGLWEHPVFFIFKTVKLYLKLIIFKHKLSVLVVTLLYLF